jgi:hypothetical protein
MTMDVRSESSPRHAAESEPAPAEAMQQVSNLLGALGEYISYYFAAKADSFKLSMRNAMLMAVVGVGALLALGATVITAIVLLLVGLAQAIAALLGGRMWAGNLIVALLVLILIGGGTFAGLAMLKKASRERTVKKYESRQDKQRTDFGANVAERAASEGQVSR